MLLLTKSLSQLLLPPGGLILLALLGVIFWRRFIGRALVLLSLALLWLLSTEPVRDALILPLEYKYPPLAMQTVPHDNAAIVLLGGGIYENAPEYGGRNALGHFAVMRTIYAADLAKATGLPVYASGGTPLTDANEAEGVVMRRWLIRFGVPAEQAFAESAANNSWENAVYMRRMLQKQGIRQVVLVTTAWHMPRSVWSFEQQGIEVIPAPCDYIAENESYDLRSFLPRWNVLADSGQALHEYLGLFWYRLRYG
jgi:uncharacterized SAM-binding protein YcdF (DUF218 family)